ncbi:glycosyltransferase family 2 protein [Pedobacter sp. JY14-1]|uniref:glycosyltransferase family 2 protein n=1 Tax=Pedobacter sp. JY14-1 TaxID=3034151 RepID=UPI0023E33268|nr:glycosyltransferase family 2 protein [Pedobacter sp. JY14-1]
MKVTIVTPVLNCINYMSGCIESVLGQDYPDLEYIIVDGGSVDGTLSVIEKYRENISRVINTKDNGSYDALNKGIALATGDLIGLLNADDLLADPSVVSAVVALVKREHCNIVYGDLDIITRNGREKVVRRWRPGRYNPVKLRFGWMPPHPTLYIGHELLRKYLPYAQHYEASADYDLILRAFGDTAANIRYLNKLMVKMRSGGQSNGSSIKLFRTFLADYRILEANGVPLPLLVAGIKKLRKLRQLC